MILKKLKLTGFLAFALFSGVSTLWAGTATIDATVTNQYIHGFGAASAWNAASNLSAYASVLWANDTTNGHVGLSLLRTRIDPTDGGSGTAWNSEAGPMTLAKSVNPNIIIWSTEWSPPAAYKGNGSVDGGGSNGTLNSSATFTGAASGSANAAGAGYAGYLTRYIKYIQTQYAVTLYAVSCQNEPDWDPTYEAAIWNAGQFDVFVPWLRGLHHGGGTAHQNYDHRKLRRPACPRGYHHGRPCGGPLGEHYRGAYLRRRTQPSFGRRLHPPDDPRKLGD